MSLAEFEAEEKGKDTITIKSRHLERIVALSASFQRYIKSMHGNRSDSYVAKQKRLRNDFYKDTPSMNVGIKSLKTSRYLPPMVDEETSRVRARGRTLDDAEEVELEDQRLRSRDGKLKQHRRTISESDDDLNQSRSKQPAHRSRQIASIEEESETEMPKLVQGSRHTQRFHEEVPEEAEIPDRNRIPSRSTREVSRNRDDEDEDLPRQTRLSQKATKKMPVYMEGEEEVHVPRRMRPTKRATMTFDDHDRYTRRESQSPAKVKRGAAKEAMRVDS